MSPETSSVYICTYICEHSHSPQPTPPFFIKEAQRFIDSYKNSTWRILTTVWVWIFVLHPFRTPKSFSSPAWPLDFFCPSMQQVLSFLRFSNQMVASSSEITFHCVSWTSLNLTFFEASYNILFFGCWGISASPTLQIIWGEEPVSFCLASLFNMYIVLEG